MTNHPALAAGRTAVVTGAASGIGKAVAIHFAREGADLLLLDRDPAVFELAAQLSGNCRARAFRIDLADPAQIAAVTMEMRDDHPQLDVLVNNAGIQYVAPLEQFPIEKWDAILSINLSSAFHTTRLALPAMRQNKFGRIINIASAHGLVASPFKAAYVAAKHGLVGLTKVVGLETAGSGVTCNAVCPGWVRTPLVEKQISDIAAERGISQKEATEELLGEKQPSLDFASPEQLGGTVAFLCSAAADQITGTAISIDGGWTAR